jgi:hypothetical protein
VNNTEIIKLIRILSANYRNWPEEGKEADTVELWAMMLSDIPIETAQQAIMMHISRSVYPPTVADIREAASRFSGPPTMDAMDAWEYITGAIRRYGLYRESEALASLPDEVARMAKRFGWRELCTNENPDTLRAQFRMAWETQNKRSKEKAVLAPALVEKLEAGFPESNLIKRLM